MKIAMLAHVRQMWNSDLVSRTINRHNQLSWIRQVKILGSRRLIAVPIPRPGTPPVPPSLSVVHTAMTIARTHPCVSRRIK